MSRGIATERDDREMKINIKNENAVQSAIDAAEGRATQRTVGASDVSFDVGAAARELVALSVSQKDSVGTRLEVSPDYDLPNSYKYPAVCTIVTVERFASAWFVTAAERVTRKKSCTKMHLSKSAQNSIALTMSLGIEI